MKLVTKLKIERIKDLLREGDLLEVYTNNSKRCGYFDKLSGESIVFRSSLQDQDRYAEDVEYITELVAYRGLRSNRIWGKGDLEE